jgi:hypothetical protein
MIDYAAVFTNYTGAFPNIEAQNVSAPGAGDGTEFVAALVNDIWGRAQALLDYAGLTPDGVQEAPDTAQILTALSKGYGIGPGIGVIYWKNGTPAANGDRVILLQGQVIEIANYPLLAAAVYVGDANNGTAPAFYKTSDAGGTTRSTSGTYMVLPDTRAVSLKGVGNQTINTRVKTGPAALGSIVEDTVQGFTFSVGVESGVGSPQNQYSMSTYNSGGHLVYWGAGSPITDGVNGTPRTGAQTQDCTIGTNFGITY